MEASPPRFAFSRHIQPKLSPHGMRALARHRRHMNGAPMPSMTHRVDNDYAKRQASWLPMNVSLVAVPTPYSNCPRRCDFSLACRPNETPPLPTKGVMDLSCPGRCQPDPPIRIHCKSSLRTKSGEVLSSSPNLVASKGRLRTEQGPVGRTQP